MGGGIKRQRLLIEAVVGALQFNNRVSVSASETLLLCYDRIWLICRLAGIVGESVISFLRSSTDAGNTDRPTRE